MKKKIAVKADNIGMRFNLSSDKVDNLKEYFIRFVKRDIAFKEFWALKNVSFTIEKGDRVAILGYNGAGKSTLIGVLAKTVTPDNGNVSVLGYDIRRDWQQFKMAIGIVPQEITFDPFLSVWETLRLQSGYFGLRHNDKWLNELLEVLDLADKKKESVMR